jgi:predicted alpha/beta hydrolase family esterase
MKTRTLIIPGWQGSGPGHWQSLWEREHPEYERVEQRDWARPRVVEWVTALHERVVASSSPVVLAAHSLGVVVVAWWAYLQPDLARERIAGALLVAPCDLESGRCLPEELTAFPAPPPEALPFPSTLVGSENDPYASLELARRIAVRLGSEFVNAGRAGHLNSASGHGPWPQGQELLGGLVRAARSRQIAA